MNLIRMMRFIQASHGATSKAWGAWTFPAVEVKSPSLGSRLAVFRKDAGLISWDTIGRYGMRNFMPDKKMKTVYCLKLSIKWNI
ncbi:hypothetical protein QQ045_007881 [Rhodiola kirilowii]